MDVSSRLVIRVPAIQRPQVVIRHQAVILEHERVIHGASTHSDHGPVKLDIGVMQACEPVSSFGFDRHCQLGN